MLVSKFLGLALLLLQCAEGSGLKRKIPVDQEGIGRCKRLKRGDSPHHLMDYEVDPVESLDDQDEYCFQSKAKELANWVIEEGYLPDEAAEVDNLLINGHFHAVKMCIQAKRPPSQDAIDFVSSTNWVDVVKGLGLCPSYDTMLQLASETPVCGWMVGNFVKNCGYLPVDDKQLASLLFALDSDAYEICLQKMGPITFPQETINKAVLRSPMTFLSRFMLCPDLETIETALSGKNLPLLIAVLKKCSFMLSEDQKAEIELAMEEAQNVSRPSLIPPMP